MIKENKTDLTLLIDFKKHRIRIHKSTLKAIGYPQYILLLVNPTKRSLIIQGSNSYTSHANCISIGVKSANKPVELYSNPLVTELAYLSPDFHPNESYLVFGKMLSSKGIACFSMTEAISVKGYTIKNAGKTYD